MRSATSPTSSRPESARKAVQPPPAVLALEGEGGVGGDLREAEGLTEHGDVLGLHLLVADANDVIGVDPPALGALLVEGEEGDLRREELLKALDLGAALAVALPAVLALHVENEVAGLAAL